MKKTKKFAIPDGYEFDRVENGEVILKRKEEVLPKTFEECRRMGVYLQYNGIINLPQGCTSAVSRLCELIIFRDAWWKKLGWEPDWKSNDLKYVIATSENVCSLSDTHYMNRILAFPTPEIRDQFYEAFKDLIKGAKELL